MSEESPNLNKLIVIDPKPLAPREQKALALRHKAEKWEKLSRGIALASFAGFPVFAISDGLVYGVTHAALCGPIIQAIAGFCFTGLVVGGLFDPSQIRRQAEWEANRVEEEKSNRRMAAAAQILDQAIADCKASPGQEFIVSPFEDTPKLLKIEKEESKSIHSEQGLVFETTLIARLYEGVPDAGGQIVKGEKEFETITRVSQPKFSILKNDGTTLG